MQLIGLPRTNVRKLRHSPEPPARPTAAIDDDEVTIADPYAAPHSSGDTTAIDYLRGGALVFVIVASSTAFWVGLAHSIGAWLAR